MMYTEIEANGSSDMWTSKYVWMGVCALVAFAGPWTAWAGTAGFEYKVQNVVQKGNKMPQLVLKATGDIQQGTVQFERDDGDASSVELGNLEEGQTKQIPIDQSSGTHDYEVTIEAEGAGGEQGESVETTFETTVTVAEPLELSVDEERARIAEGQLDVRSNRPLERVELTITDSDGETLQAGTQSVGGSRTFQVTWPDDAEIGSIELKAYGPHGFWRGLQLQPFWVKIPHKEVRFQFGEADWKDDQVSKLRDSLDKIREAMQEHRNKGLDMKLYIAGYTDTVGSKSSNRDLSRKRARAIGDWFRQQGLGIPVYYQGFGEDVLAVETPDETEKKANRRAIYILGNATPPTSETIPRSNWRPLD